MSEWDNSSNQNQGRPLIDENIFGAGILEEKGSFSKNDNMYPNTVKPSEGMDGANMQGIGGIDIASNANVGNTYHNPALPKDGIQKSSNKPMIVALVLLFVLLLGLISYVAVSLTKGFSSLTVKKDSTYTTDAQDPWAEILGEDADQDKDSDQDFSKDFSSGFHFSFGTDDGFDFDSSIDGFDGFLDGFGGQNGGQSGNQGNAAPSQGTFDFSDDTWKEAYVNHDRSEFTGPYYEDFVDSIDVNTKYEIERLFEEESDPQKNSVVRVSYVQLKGDLPNLEQINKVLKDTAMLDLEQYKENKAEYDAMVSQYGLGVSIENKSLVTYNDEETISVAIMKEVYICGRTELMVKGVNINLVTGTVMDNTQILKLDDSFGEEFRQRSNKQNGQSAGVDLFTNGEIVSMLNKDDAIIIFYTPVGLELGYSYRKSGSAGWITISMQDYKEYLNGL